MLQSNCERGSKPGLFGFSGIEPVDHGETTHKALEANQQLHSEVTTLDSRLSDGYDTKVHKAKTTIEVPLLDPPL